MTLRSPSFRTAVIGLLLFAVATSLHAAPDDLVTTPKAKANVGAQPFGLNVDQIESNLFQPHGSAKQARQYIDSTLNLRIDEIHRACQLTDQQRTKLVLAAANDVNRYFDQADAVLRKFKNGLVGQMDWNNFWVEVQPLQQKLARGLFSESSFFEKAIIHVLDQRQREGYEQLSHDRRLFRYRSSIEATFVTLQKSVPLLKSQQEQLMSLLIDESEPPKLFGNNARFLVLHRMARLPEDKVKAILNEHQWQKFKAETKRFEHQVPFLVQQGLLDEEELKNETPARKGVTPPATLPPADGQKPENDK